QFRRQASGMAPSQHLPINRLGRGQGFAVAIGAGPPVCRRRAVALDQAGVPLVAVESELLVLLGLAQGLEARHLARLPAAHEEAVPTPRALVVAAADRARVSPVDGSEMGLAGRAHARWPSGGWPMPARSASRASPLSAISRTEFRPCTSAIPAGSHPRRRN